MTILTMKSVKEIEQSLYVVGWVSSVQFFFNSLAPFNKAWLFVVVTPMTKAVGFLIMEKILTCTAMNLRNK